MTDSGELLYLGCYTSEAGGRGEDIAVARRDPDTGELTLIGTVATTPAPSFLARHPTLPVLYAVHEVDAGLVSAWAIHPDGALSALGQRSTGGASPCHVAVSPAGDYLFVANYGSGSVAAYPLDLAGVPAERTELITHAGTGADPERQEGPHAHMVSPDPRGGPLLAIDLGTDSVYRYDLAVETGRLRPHGPPLRTRPGTGPRHLARHPDGRRLFLVGELDATVLAYGYDDAGELVERGRVPASGRTGPVQPSEVGVGPGGDHLYVANRGTGTITVFALDADAPRQVAEVAAGGDWPRHFAIVGAHLYVAQERDDSVVRFAIDPGTGVPAPAGVPLAVPSPTCVLPVTVR